MLTVMDTDNLSRRAGRPRAIPDALEPVVMELHREGYGYRAIARILREEHGANTSFASVRRALLRLGRVNRGAPLIGKQGVEGKVKPKKLNK